MAVLVAVFLLSPAVAVVAVVAAAVRDELAWQRFKREHGIR